jgi:hypothetical protein
MKFPKIIIFLYNLSLCMERKCDSFSCANGFDDFPNEHGLAKRNDRSELVSDTPFLNKVSDFVSDTIHKSPLRSIVPKFVSDTTRQSSYQNEIPDNAMLQNRGGNRSCSNLSVTQMDRLCKSSESQFKRFDPSASILPGIGLPSQNKGVCTILHTMGPGAKNLKINGLESKSPLANAALFSSECSNGRFLNLYEMMLPEGISGAPGQKSNSELYAEELNRNGINVAGTHWHWWASEPYVAAIHHQNVGMNPIEFSNLTTNALGNYSNRMNSGSYK